MFNLNSADIALTYIASSESTRVADSNMREENFYRPLEKHLDVINKECIAMEKSATQFSVALTMEILKVLIHKLKSADELFRLLFNRITYVGSFYDGLRVKEATEFDLNVVLKMPLDYDKIEVTRESKYPGFVKMNVKNAKYTGDKLAKHLFETNQVFKWVDQSGYLSHMKVLRWWESIFSKMGHYGEQNLEVNGRIYHAGPATTVWIVGDGKHIDIDLVPVMEFTKDHRPPPLITWKNQEDLWYVVPKRFEENEALWRLSFPVQEKRIMNGLYSLKITNRFLKRYRDAAEWKELASYYIKTIFLWEAHTKESEYFQKNKGFLFVYFLEKLHEYLNKGELPFFWDKQMNLFSKIKPISLKNYADCVKRQKLKLERLLQEDNRLELDSFIYKLFHSPSARRTPDNEYEFVETWEDSSEFGVPDSSTQQGLTTEAGLTKWHIIAAGALVTGAIILSLFKKNQKGSS